MEIPLGLLKNIVWALNTAVDEMKEDGDFDSGKEFVVLEVTSLDEALIKVLEHHPEPEVGKWVISEIKKLNGGRSDTPTL